MTAGEKGYRDWLKYLSEHPETIEVVDDGNNAEHSDFVICRLKTEPLMLPDNLVGHCSKCFRMVQFRPHAPKTPKRLCDQCAGPLFQKDMKEGNFKSFITPNTARDLQDILRRKRSN